MKLHKLIRSFTILFLLLLSSLFLGSCKETTDRTSSFTNPTSLTLDNTFAFRYLQPLYETKDTQFQQYMKSKALLLPTVSINDSVATFANAKRLIDYPRFMDDTGFITTFKKVPQNVAVLFSSYAQVWQLAGGKVSITVEESVTRDLVKEDDVHLVGQGSGKEINFELLLSYQPDLVILTADYEAHLEIADRLRMFDIPVLVLRVDSFADYLNMLSMFTQILGTKDNYQTYGSEVLDSVEHILNLTSQMTTHPNVLFLRAYSYGAKVKTSEHFVGQMLNELGAINIAESKQFPLDTLSPEIIAASNVDSIFISIMGEDEEAVIHYVERELLVQPAFSSLNAVKSHKYYILPKELFSFKPNQNWAKAYEYLANLLYPELNLKE